MRADAVYLGVLLTAGDLSKLVTLWDSLPLFMRGELLPRVQEQDGCFYILPAPILVNLAASQPPDRVDLAPLHRKLDYILDEVRRLK